MVPELRPGTADSAIWQSVFVANEYQLPEDLAGQVVLDVGSNIGAFSCAAKIRGAAEVWAVEPDSPNMALAFLNWSRCPGPGVLQQYHGACWRSDRRGDRLSLGKSADCHTGGYWTLPYAENCEQVCNFPLDDLIKSCTDWGRRRLDLLKLDCESAEWPILFSSRGLHLVHAICGEYHAGGFDQFPAEKKIEGITYSIAALHELLSRAGFTVKIDDPNWDHYGLFWAVRPRGITSPHRSSAELPTK